MLKKLNKNYFNETLKNHIKSNNKKIIIEINNKYNLHKNLIYQCGALKKKIGLDYRIEKKEQVLNFLINP